MDPVTAARVVSLVGNNEPGDVNVNANTRRLAGRRCLQDSVQSYRDSNAPHMRALRLYQARDAATACAKRRRAQR